jgi:hypothetical protein
LSPDPDRRAAAPPEAHLRAGAILRRRSNKVPEDLWMIPPCLIDASPHPRRARTVRAIGRICLRTQLLGECRLAGAPDGDRYRGVEWEGRMPGRTFQDHDGSSWLVWQVLPGEELEARGGAGALVPATMADGLLTFENGPEKRRVYPVPPRWMDPRMTNSPRSAARRLPSGRSASRQQADAPSVRGPGRWMRSPRGWDTHRAKYEHGVSRELRYRKMRGVSRPPGW